MKKIPAPRILDSNLFVSDTCLLWFPWRYLSQVDYIKGFGKLGGPNTVNVDLTEGGTQSLETKNILIATGSEVTPLPPVPVDNAQGKIVDSTGALDLKEVI